MCELQLMEELYPEVDVEAEKEFIMDSFVTLHICPSCGRFCNDTDLSDYFFTGICSKCRCEQYGWKDTCIECGKSFCSMGKSNAPFCSRACEIEFYSWQMTPCTLKCALDNAMFYIRAEEAAPF